METLYLTNKLRQELKKPLGTLILGTKREVAKKFKQISEKRRFKKVITAGDYCSSSLPSNIKIFDGRVERNKKVPIPKYSLSALNPPASIHKGVWKILKRAIEENKNVFINGEEDLLALSCVLLAKKGDAVVYGLPNKGVCLIEVSSQAQKETNKILKKFKKEKFKKIVLGGTFSLFHQGHQYLLKMAKYYAKKAIIGLCSDEMVKKRKRNWKKIQPFKKRRNALKNYLDKINLPREIVEIQDIYGPGIYDKSLEAILLTEETLKNGKKINKIRKQKGLSELNYIVLPYLLDKTGKKISSSRIRNPKSEIRNPNEVEDHRLYRDKPQIPNHK